MTGTRSTNDILSEGTSWGLFDQVVPMYNSLVISIDIAPNHKANSELLSSLASDQSSFSSFASQSGSGSEVISMSPVSLDSSEIQLAGMVYLCHLLIFILPEGSCQHQGPPFAV
ncbi:hypothetical protein Q7C36_019027 [Tachysurus vachellii]|uniref:Uncharacterized protein n=1 Tax=Tachysurus vachellii TaxID=175792 RepID=A0AA88LVT0_TACVA|nr:hypothetical protein Q7C36_019027 [Tachysurus vachellii]